MSDDEADRSAFYSNLLAPSLPDFEKFHWLSARAKSKKMTQEQLADEAGISRQLVGFLLSFDKLPKESIAALNSAADKSILSIAAADTLSNRKSYANDWTILGLKQDRLKVSYYQRNATGTKDAYVGTMEPGF